MDFITLTISIIAVIISVVGFYLARFNEGTIKMTRPTMIYFGPDAKGSIVMKVLIRTLLYSTSEKGHYVQNVYLKLSSANEINYFNIWVHANNMSEGYMRGSGLYLDKTGSLLFHQFIMHRPESEKFKFDSKKYTLEFFVETVNSKVLSLFKTNLELSEKDIAEMNFRKVGIFFDWSSEKNDYVKHIENKRKIRRNNKLPNKK